MNSWFLHKTFIFLFSLITESNQRNLRISEETRARDGEMECRSRNECSKSVTLTQHLKFIYSESSQRDFSSSSPSFRLFFVRPAYRWKSTRRKITSTQRFKIFRWKSIFWNMNIIHRTSLEGINMSDSTLTFCFDSRIWLGCGRSLSNEFF